jgi:hypothetical protein
VIHLYALSSAAPSTPVTGLDGAPITHPACGSLVASVSEHPRAPEPTRERALAHAAAISAVADQVPTLPVRFGVVHTGLDPLRRTLADHEEDLLGALDRVGGCVEFVVRGAPPPQAPPPRPPLPDEGGRAYMQRRLTEDRAARERDAATAAVVTVATDPLRDLARQVLDRTGASGPERCFLVDRVQVAAFAAAAGELLAERDDLVLGGPWPPFSFTTAEIGS